jgi:hypothetical protein
LADFYKNRQNVQVPKKKLFRIRDSKNLSAIDATLLSGVSLPEARKMIADKLSETYCINTLKARRLELKATAANMQKKMKAEYVAAYETKKDTVYILKTLEQEAVSIMNALLPPEHQQYKAVENLKNMITSVIRRSEELYADVDFLAVFRYAINMQQIRVAKMAELEVTIGLPMHDQTDNLRTLVDMVERGVNLYKGMGLKPKFGDPSQNRQANLGMDDKETESMKRSKTMQKRIAEIKKLPPEQQQKAFDEYRRELFPGIVTKAPPVNI